MTTLDMSYNKFTGQIPPSMQNLSKLVDIRLIDNMLSGEIPTGLLEFKSLKILHIGGKGSNLIWNNNNADIVPRCSLIEILMPYCGISGQIPEWVSSQKDLVFLDLNGNRLEGKFPVWLAKMNFRLLSLSGNNLSGPIPSPVFDNGKLLILDLSRNNFSGELPQNIGNARSLDTLVLSKNRFSGDNLHVFGHGFNFDVLDLSYNNFSGNIPISFPKGIRYLFLGGNKFSGNLPWNLTKLVNLELLDIHENNITGNLHSTLPLIPSLRVLVLRNNSLEGCIPSSISNLTSLQILDLSYNNISGSIPREISKIVGMIQTVNISISFHNIHNIFDSFVELEELIVNWKKSFQGLEFLNLAVPYIMLDLSHNRIYGEIPPSLGKLKALKVLNIAHNRISGHIPTSFGDLVNIESLDLSHNEISGRIPQSLVKLSQLTVLDVSNNKLTGKIPVGGQMTTMDELSYYENNCGLCGMQIRVPCPEDILRTEEREQEDEEQSWFLWEGAWVGYPVGFFSSILVMGYFLDFLRLFKVW